MFTLEVVTTRVEGKTSHKQLKLGEGPKIRCPQNEFEIVKSGIVMLTGREKTDTTDADVTVGWML
jgi:hypothetical protein